ncbi:TPA: phosphoadenosine phosphosulfate reductase family protein [Escherichia coli]|nr:phosphoadenosine phosphosulfate reductase family protein [Escherichia coli]
MKHQVISFSGGRTSAYMTLEVLKIHPDAEVIFMDTGGEHPKTYEFIKNLSSHFNIKITCLRCVPPAIKYGKFSYEIISIDDIKCDLVPWRRILEHYGHPYIGGAFCTHRMKQLPFEKYCDEHYGKGNYERWLGIRADEPRRLHEREGFHYLADISDFEKQDIIDWWSWQSFDLEIPEHLGNCVFCIKKSNKKLSLAARDEPELYDQFCSCIAEHDCKEGKPEMYRNKMALQDVIAMFRMEETEEIRSSIINRKEFDSGSCSESCEAFACDNNVI